eukprot:11627877-Alexandrium_andersonii.AAC.1
MPWWAPEPRTWWLRLGFSMGPRRRPRCPGLAGATGPRMGPWSRTLVRPWPTSGARATACVASRSRSH